MAILNLVETLHFDHATEEDKESGEISCSVSLDGVGKLRCVMDGDGGRSLRLAVVTDLDLSRGAGASVEDFRLLSECADIAMRKHLLHSLLYTSCEVCCMRQFEGVPFSTERLSFVPRLKLIVSWDDVKTLGGKKGTALFEMNNIPRTEEALTKFYGLDFMFQFKPVAIDDRRGIFVSAFDVLSIVADILSDAEEASLVSKDSPLLKRVIFSLGGDGLMREVNLSGGVHGSFLAMLGWCASKHNR